MSVDRALAQHVLEGLSAAQKALSSAWFYDEEGSRLFQRIMALPEYYLTRTEHALLRDRADDLRQWLAPDHRPLDLVELGSGDGEKTLTLCRALLEAGVDAIYRPMDVSAHALGELRQRFAMQLPGLALEPVLGDYFSHWPATSAGRRQVAMLLGSNLGNLDEPGAVALLQRVRAQLHDGDALLLGLDLVKDPRVIHAAYDDAEGVTAAFNLNLLRRLNRELGMNFDTSRFAHFASYNPLDGAMRSFLVSTAAQTVSCAALDREFDFACGETIYTEQSQKYSLPMIERLARLSGFEHTGLITDASRWYALALWHRPVDAR